MTIWTNCTVTGTEIFKIQKQPPEVFLISSQKSKENTYARFSYLIKLQVSSLFLKLLKLKYDSGRQQLCDKKLLWKHLENIQEHICIGLELLLSSKFRKIKDWLNSHNN